MSARPAIDFKGWLRRGAFMSFLWLTRFVPYPPKSPASQLGHSIRSLYGGDITYTARLLEHLAAIATVEVLCYQEHSDPPPHISGLKWNVLSWTIQPRWRSVIAGNPNVAVQYQRRAFIDRMIALAEAADTVVIDHLGMAWCAELLNAHFAARPLLRRPVLIFIPIDHNKSVRQQAASQVRNLVMRQLVAWDAWKATRLEDRAMRLVDGVVVLTERDQALFQLDHPSARYIVLQPGYDGTILEQRTINAAIPERICVLGGRGSFHKQLVLKQCLTALQAQRPIAQYLDVVGFIEPALKTKLEASYSNLNFRGYVESIEAYLTTVRLGLMPDAVGGGFKLRALTYVFNRVPIIAVRGALDGMGLTPGEHYIEAPDMDSLVTMARHTVGDFALLNRISNNAMRICSGRFDWRDRVIALSRFADALAVRRKAPAPLADAGSAASVW